MRRVVIGVDPSGTRGGDACGIVAAGVDARGHLVVLEDATLQASPDEWARAVVACYDRNQADRVVVEANFGGELAETVLHTVRRGLPVKNVHASRGKQQRAEPVAAIYEQSRAHHVGVLPELETEMTSWEPGGDWSPNRVDACLVAGTEVLTAGGLTPIEEVVPGSKLWTREGWRRVERAWCSGRNVPVFTVALSNGKALTGTANHRVWVDNQGWTRLDALVCGDRLDGWNHLPKSSTTESSTNETPTVRNALTASTTPLPEASYQRLSTERSGSTITAPYPPGITSTTSTMTRSTTIPRTLPRSARSSTQNSTAPNTRKLVEPGWSRFVLSRPRGTAARMGVHGMPNTAGEHGRDVSLASKRVSNVARRLKRWLSMGVATSGTAHANVIAGPPTPSTSISGRLRARFAGHSFGSRTIGRSLRRAPVFVERASVRVGRADVYDLTVSGVHEFVASGVVVHNCVWAATDLVLGGSTPAVVSSSVGVRLPKTRISSYA